MTSECRDIAHSVRQAQFYMMFDCGANIKVKRQILKISNFERAESWIYTCRFRWILDLHFTKLCTFWLLGVTSKTNADLQKRIRRPRTQDTVGTLRATMSRLWNSLFRATMSRLVTYPEKHRNYFFKFTKFGTLGWFSMLIMKNHVVWPKSDFFQIKSIKNRKSG